MPTKLRIRFDNLNNGVLDLNDDYIVWDVGLNFRDGAGLIRVSVYEADYDVVSDVQGSGLVLVFDLLLKKRSELRKLLGRQLVIEEPSFYTSPPTFFSFARA